MNKEEFKQIIAKSYSGYLIHDEHTMDNSDILYTDNLNQFNEHCKDSNVTFLGFCPAPYPKEICYNKNHSIVFDMAMVFEFNSSFKKYWFHVDKEIIYIIIQNFLDLGYNNPETNRLLANLT